MSQVYQRARAPLVAVYLLRQNYQAYSLLTYVIASNLHRYVCSRLWNLIANAIKQYTCSTGSATGYNNSAKVLSTTLFQTSVPATAYVDVRSITYDRVVRKPMADNKVMK